MNVGFPKPRSWWRWWQALPQNPIYLRERGGWGKPNPFYDTLSRFSPFIVMGAIVSGLCAGFSNPAFFAGESLLALWCFLCLPSFLLSALTIFASLMAPALTAPSISMEIDRGTWDLLRVTPQSTHSILLAKLFGALARLRIWRVLFALSMLQGLLIAGSISLAGGTLSLWGAPLGIAAIIRPWLEILFAAFLGMYLSTRVRSATMALAATYTGLILFKIFNSSSLWLAVTALLGLEEATLLVSGGIGPTAVYSLAITALWLGLVRQANKL